MATLEVVNRLKVVEQWNRWRLANPHTSPDLAGAALPGAYLRRALLDRADLTDANLINVDLSGADLTDAQLRGANLFAANLSEASLRGVDLSYANLSGANLTGADLSNAILRRCGVHGTDFSSARFAWTVLGDLDLSEVIGLESAVHLAPSSLGVDSILRSAGSMPEVFLSGTGLPDSFIAYVSSLIGHTGKLLSCFISYSTRDQRFADRLYSDLKAHKVRCWIAPEDLPFGAVTRVSIDEAIRHHDRLLVVLSRHSITDDRVEKEVATALEREQRENRQVLIPVRLDEHVMEVRDGWAADVRRGRHIGDFSSWRRGDTYARALDRLLGVLKSDVANLNPPS
jgi:hypothetical protein